MNPRTITLFAGLLFGVPAVHANEIAMLGNMSCKVPDGWLLQKSPSTMVRYAAPKSVYIDGREMKLMMILSKHPANEVATVEQFKKNLEPKLLGSPKKLETEIFVRDGIKLLKVSNSGSNRLSSIALHYVDGKGLSSLSIVGPKELFDANKDVIKKTLDDFRVQNAAPAGAGKPDARTESDSEGGDKLSPESKGCSR